MSKLTARVKNTMDRRLICGNRRPATRSIYARISDPAGGNLGNFWEGPFVARMRMNMSLTGRSKRRWFRLRSGFALLAAVCLFGCVRHTAIAAEPPAPEPMQPYTVSVHGKSVTFDMATISGGIATLGSPNGEADRDKSEGPQIQVQVEPFWMGVHEVTWAEYEQFLRIYSTTQDQGGAPPIPSDQNADAVSIPTPLWQQDTQPVFEVMGVGGKYPAILMSQTAAKQYCKWLSKKTGHFYRLPTEAEWEYAARSETTTAYSFGDQADDLEDHGWYFDNSELEDGDAGYREVGQKKPNAWGLYDMHGNVAEWVLDGYDADHYKKLHEKYAGSPIPWAEAICPPTQRHDRVIRGGGWDSDAEDCRSAARGHTTSNFTTKDPQLPRSPWWNTEFWIGFRLVRPMHEPSEQEKLKYWEADTADILDAIEAKRDREVRVLVEKKD